MQQSVFFLPEFADSCPPTPQPCGIDKLDSPFVSVTGLFPEPTMDTFPFREPVFVPPNAFLVPASSDCPIAAST